MIGGDVLDRRGGAAATRGPAAGRRPAAFGASAATGECGLVQLRRNEQTVPARSRRARWRRSPLPRSASRTLQRLAHRRAPRCSPLTATTVWPVCVRADQNPHGRATARPGRWRGAAREPASSLSTREARTSWSRPPQRPSATGTSSRVVSAETRRPSSSACRRAAPSRTSAAGRWSPSACSPARSPGTAGRRPGGARAWSRRRGPARATTTSGARSSWATIGSDGARPPAW